MNRRGPPSMSCAELGLHGLRSWGRNWSRKVRETRSSHSQKRSEPTVMRGQAGDEHGGSPWFPGGVEPDGVSCLAGRVRRACDDAPLSVPVRLCDAPYLLAPGKRGLPATFPWHLFSRPTPTPFAVGRKLGSFSCSISPWFVLNHDMPMINTTSNWLRFGVFLSPTVPSFRIHWPLTTVLVLLTTILPFHAPRRTREPAGSGRAQTVPRWLLPVQPTANCQGTCEHRSRRAGPLSSVCACIAIFCGQITAFLHSLAFDVYRFISDWQAHFVQPSRSLSCTKQP